MGDEQNVVKCPVCGTWIGSIISIEGQDRLRIGSIYVNVARGVCAGCGSEFHWSISERMLAELIRHVIEIRNGK